LFSSLFSFVLQSSCARLGVFVFALFTVLISAGQSLGADLLVGDKVQFLYSGEVLEGEVVEFNRQNRPVVKFTHGGREKKIAFTWNKISRFKPSPKPEKNASGETIKKLRTWTNSTGKFKVSAYLLKSDSSSVQLKTEDGNVVTLPLTKLSRADQDWLIAQSTSEPSGENPSQAGFQRPQKEESSTTNGVAMARANAPASVKRLELIGPVLETVAAPALDQSKVELKAPAESYVPTAALPFGNNLKPLRLPALKEGGWDKQWDVSIHKSSNGSFLGVGAATVFKKFSEITVFSLETGSSKTVILPLKNCKLLAVSPDGARLFTERFGCSDLWEINEAGLTHKFSWKLPSLFDAEWKIIDNVLLCVSKSKAVAWDWEQQSPIYSIDCDKPTLQANCERMAIIKNSSVYIVNVRNGETVQMIDTKTYCYNAVISPNGETLMTVDWGISSWNLSKGELSNHDDRKSTAFRTLDRVKSLRWLNDDQLLMNDRFLFDRERLIEYWQFTRPKNQELVEIGSGNFYYHLQPDELKPVRLLPEVFPGEHAGKKPEEFLLLKPGLKLSLDLSALPFENDDNQSIRDSLSAKLKALEVEVADSGPLVLRLSVTNGKKVSREFKTVKLSDITSGEIQKKSYSVSWDEILYRARILRDGKTLWEVSISNSLSFLDRIPGKTQQQVATEMTKLGPGKFLDLKLPIRQLDTPDRKPYKSSVLSASVVESN